MVRMQQVSNTVTLPRLLLVQTIVTARRCKAHLWIVSMIDRSNTWVIMWLISTLNSDRFMSVKETITSGLETPTHHYLEM